MRRLWLLVFLVLLMIPATEAHAQCVTDVQPGTISGETWTLAGSPYCLKGDIQVNNLVISPGVRVEADGDYKIEIIGTITAIGAELNQIFFTATPENVDGWQGIDFNVSVPGSELAYFIVENSIDSGIEIFSSEPTIRDCAVQNNSTVGGGPRGGGGIYTDAALTLTRCTIADNVVTLGGGTNIGSAGGGIYSDAALTLVDSTVSGNEASMFGFINSSIHAHGGGVYSAAALTLIRSIVDSNVAIASNPCAGGCSRTTRGAGIYALGQTNIINSFVTRNTQDALPQDFGSWTETGGGIHLASGGTIAFTHATVADNAREGLHVEDGASASALNSIFWNNSVAQIAGPGVTSATFSDVDGGWPGDGNVDINPVFKLADASNPAYDVHIDPFSPVIDMGDSTDPSLPTDDIDGDLRPAQSGFDMGADEVPGGVIMLGPDLSARVEIFSSTGFATNVSGTIQVENTGDEDTGAFGVRIILADGPNREIILTQAIGGGVPAGGTFAVNFDHPSVSSLSDQQIMVIVDFDGRVSETDETNNRKRIIIP